MRIRFSLGSLAFLLLLSIVSCTRKTESLREFRYSDSLEVATLKEKALSFQYTQPDSSIILLKKMGELCHRNKNNDGLIDNYRISCSVYGIVLREPKLSKLYADSAWNLSQQEGNEHLIYKGHFALGSYYTANEDYPNAIHHLLLALQLQPKPVDSNNYVFICSHLAAIYTAQESYRSAIRYYQPVIDYVGSGKDTAKMILVHINQAINFAKLKEFPNCKQHLFYAKMLLDYHNDSSLRPFLYCNIGSYYFDVQNADSCLFYLKKAIAIGNINRKKNNNTDGIENSYLVLIRQYIKLGDYSLAGRAITELDQIMDTNRLNMQDRLDYYESVYRYNKYNKNTHSALQALEKSNEIKKIVSDSVVKKTMLNHEKELKKIGGEKLILEKNHKLKRQELYIVIISICALLFLFSSLAIYLYWKKKKLLEQVKWKFKEQQLVLEQEKSLLQLQIDERNRIAHEMHDDLGSTTTSMNIGLELLNVDPTSQEALSIINKAIGAFNNQINEIIWSQNVQNNHFSTFKDYIHRFAYNFLKESKIQLEWQEQDVAFDFIILGHIRRRIYLSIKELLNNVVKHAHASKVIINIKIEQKPDTLIVHVIDNGIGFKLKQADTTKTNQGGIGIISMKREIEKLQGTISWMEDNGIHVFITMPLR